MRNDIHANHIGSLPFGAEAAFVHNNINEFTDAVSSSINTLQGYNHIGSANKFHYASSHVDVCGLKLSSSVSSPSSYSAKESKGLYFFLPVSGSATATIDGKTGVSAADEHAFFSPELTRSGSTTYLSMVQASLCETRLAATAKCMLGEKGFRKIESSLTRPNYLSINSNGVNYSSQFSHIFHLMDDVKLNPTMLRRLGIDDLFYRTTLSMIIDNAGIDSIYNEYEVPISNVTDQVTEYISANFSDEINLTMLEGISGVSGKRLAKEFKRRYNCTPMQWLQNYRLDVFRRSLQTARHGQTVTNLAFSCGFTRLGALSARYFEVYGEKPSQTLASAKSRYLSN